MRKPDWVKKHRVLVACIGTATIVLVTLAIAKPDLIGLAADSTTNIERNAKGEVIKTVEIRQPAKTLWDLLQLFGTIALPVLLLILANRFQEQGKEAQEIRQQSEKEIAEDNQRGQALETYLDRVSDIVLDYQFFSLDRHKSDEKMKYHMALYVIRARTLEILRRFGQGKNSIDHERKGRVFLFLYDVELICSNDKTLKTVLERKVNIEMPLLNLIKVDFSGAYLSGAYLGRCNICFVNLSDANLCGAYLGDANLSGTNLSRANLRDTDLICTNLYVTNLRDADLRDADLSGADLGGADLSGADLSGAKYNDATALPIDFDPKLRGMVKGL